MCGAIRFGHKNKRSVDTDHFFLQLDTVALVSHNFGVRFSAIILVKRLEIHKRPIADQLNYVTDIQEIRVRCLLSNSR